MTITIKTDHVATVYEILLHLFPHCDIVKAEEFTVRVTCDTDALYRSIATWLTDAFGCRLIIGYDLYRE